MSKLVFRSVWCNYLLITRSGGIFAYDKKYIQAHLIQQVGKSCPSCLFIQKKKRHVKLKKNFYFENNEGKKKNLKVLSFYIFKLKCHPDLLTESIPKEKSMLLIFFLEIIYLMWMIRNFNFLWSSSVLEITRKEATFLWYIKEKKAFKIKTHKLKNVRHRIKNVCFTKKKRNPQLKNYQAYSKIIFFSRALLTSLHQYGKKNQN